MAKGVKLAITMAYWPEYSKTKKGGASFLLSVANLGKGNQYIYEGVTWKQSVVTNLQSIKVVANPKDDPEEQEETNIYDLWFNPDVSRSAPRRVYEIGDDTESFYAAMILQYGVAYCPNMIEGHTDKYTPAPKKDDGMFVVCFCLVVKKICWRFFGNLLFCGG